MERGSFMDQRTIKKFLYLCSKYVEYKLDNNFYLCVKNVSCDSQEGGLVWSFTPKLLDT